MQSPMPSLYPIACPCCGETIELPIDASAGAYDCIEDCHVCCRPIEVSVRLDPAGTPSIRVRADEEG